MNGDEKIGLAIAGHAMTQLCDFAKRHNLENDLYYGGGLETVLGLLGDSKKQRFISENGSAHMHKRDIWNNLVKFLENEFTLCENLTAYEKAEQCLNINAWNEGATKRGVNQTFYKHSKNVATVHDKMECYI